RDRWSEWNAGHPAVPAASSATRRARRLDRRPDHVADPNDSPDRAGRNRVANRVGAVEVPLDSFTGPPLASRRAAVDPVPRVGHRGRNLNYST
ncbi:MAG: hypothetical protein LH616_16795, partial [Ilumatobacteraceae bacterium]|nr:hypothetical protein [Ilumatobacteraceae bacterium]